MKSKSRLEVYYNKENPIKLLGKKVKFKVNDMIRFGTIGSVCVNNLNGMVEKVNIISEHNNWYMRKMTEVEKVRD